MGKGVSSSDVRWKGAAEGRLAHWMNAEGVLAEHSALIVLAAIVGVLRGVGVDEAAVVGVDG